MNNRILAYLPLIACLVASSGCVTRQLDPSGPYHGDLILYQADGVIVDLDRAYDEFTALALRHPAFFTSNEKAASLFAQITVERDGIWESDEVLAALFMARDAYVHARDGASHANLRGAIQAARAFIMELQAYAIQDRR